MAGRFLYSEKMIQWLVANCKGVPSYELAHLFNAEFETNKTPQQIMACLKNRGIKTGALKGIPKGSCLKYSEEQVAFLKDQYKTLSRTELTEAFNAKFGTSEQMTQILAFLKNHKIKSGRDGRYQKGNVPWIAGTKGAVGPNSGSFKKGHVPHNAGELWQERLHEDGYILMSVPITNPHTGAPSRFVLKHRWEWEKENGPIPDDMVLKCISGVKTDCRPENWELVSRKALPKLRALAFEKLSPELKGSALLIAKIQSHPLYEQMD